ncbi:RNA-binding protein CP29B, chloroplastic-like [Hibiscus syriacus]|uniref:RNA-binding protein CP29B, chloroplastic-like n=1 Tax=Hibiscus syriacus TaxID=106335 RepID=UPI001924A748|nr:RNA-binding protein CP29B, chloroplastic-like [Hibiscus syriacus]
MSVSSASSLILPSFAPKTLSLPNQRPISLSPFSLSHRLHAKPLSCSALQSFELLARKSLSSPSKFVRNVSVSSEYGQEAGLLGSDDEEAASFSPDLKLFVGNLPFSVDSGQLAGLFGSAGNVQMVEVIYDKVTGRSRGFGFVTMSTTEEVKAAAQQFNGYELEGRALRVNSGPPPPRREEFSPRGARGGGATMGASNRVYIGNLSWGVDDVALETLFSEQGKVVEAKVVYDRESGRSRGFGFVTYNSTEEVDSAIKTFDGVELDGRPIRVSVAETKLRRQF